MWAAGQLYLLRENSFKKRLLTGALGFDRMGAISKR